jgi:SanA protein
VSQPNKFNEEDLPEEEMSDHEPTFLERMKERLDGEMRWFDSFLRRNLFRFVMFSLHFCVILGCIYALVWWMARDHVYNHVKDVPARMVGLVLGCVKEVNGRPNAFFDSRIKTAAKLYEEGKVQFLLVSGDNHTRGQTEPQDMKAALIKKGVPANHIYCDYAGFRTLDSIVRARKIFGQTEFTIVSQRFHNERALYMARRFGMEDSVAINADDINTESMLKMYVREIFARLMAVLDVELLNTRPRFLGEKIEIGDKTPPVDADPMAAGS